MNIETLKQQFADRFGRPCQHIVRAPGRVNLIGEHTDYNDGFVLPIAIDRQSWAACAPRDDTQATFASVQMDHTRTIDVMANLEPIGSEWTNYPVGVAAGLAEAIGPLGGIDVLFDSHVPQGGGLSSSAALEVSTAQAFLACQQAEIEPMALARICQAAEHNFAGAPCGIMDQAISVLGQVGCALLLDCRSSEVRQIPFNDPELTLLVVNTDVQHAINDGGYAARRQQCEEAADILALPSLRDATSEMLDQASEQGSLNEIHLKRARHVVGEIARTLDAVEALEKDNYLQFGELMYASHASLRDDYEVSCPELDCVVELARACDGVYGARMTGGGFGGCAIVLANRAQAHKISQMIRDGFVGRFDHEPPTFATTAGPGAEQVE